MPGLKTSKSFYRRGVPNDFKDFGKIASANYPIFQPTPILNKTSYLNNNMRSLISHK